MSILETILKANNGDLVKQVAGSLDIKPQDAGAAIAKMLPALTGSMKNNVNASGGLDSLLGALTRGNHARYVDNPAEVVRDTGIADGNAILGHLLGSKQRSREVAAEASRDTGMDVGILKKMLPMIATMAMGSLSKQQSQGGALSDLASQGSNGRGLL
ncbi:MAG: DUF937 domain-containing protein, partial [Pseudomonadota bacterium]